MRTSGRMAAMQALLQFIHGNRDVATDASLGVIGEILIRGERDIEKLYQFSAKEGSS